MSLSSSGQETKIDDELSFQQSQQLLTQEKSFDYAVLSPQVRVLIQNKTFELKSLMRRSAQDIVDIGQKLIEVKEQLGHGNFRAWLKAEFDWSLRTAARFMQVAVQFKCAKLAHLNIAVSALYLLAQPSTSKKARETALELAREGENITRAKAEEIVNSHQELAQPDECQPSRIDIPAMDTESSSSALSQAARQRTYSQLKPRDDANLASVEPSVEAVHNIDLDKRLEQKTIRTIDSVSEEHLGGPALSHTEHSRHIRILNIEHQHQELATSIAQTFKMTFAGVRVDFEGNPEALITLFEQMQNNLAFTEKVLQQAKLLAEGNS